MELLKVSESSVILSTYSWALWICLLSMSPQGGSCLPSLTGPISEAVVISEGSGYGQVFPSPVLTDDDADEEDDDGGRGSGEWYKEGSGYLPEVVIDDTATFLESLKVKCFRCHGDGNSGCDIAAMLADTHKFSVTCFGKCLNLTSGSTSVYDCAHDMVTRRDNCFKNRDTELCFCTGHFCNGPSPLSRHDSIAGQVVFDEAQGVNDIEYNVNDIEHGVNDRKHNVNTKQGFEQPLVPPETPKYDQNGNDLVEQTNYNHDSIMDVLSNNHNNEVIIYPRKHANVYKGIPNNLKKDRLGRKYFNTMKQFSTGSYVKDFPALLELQQLNSGIIPRSPTEPKEQKSHDLIDASLSDFEETTGMRNRTSDVVLTTISGGFEHAAFMDERKTLIAIANNGVEGMCRTTVLCRALSYLGLLMSVMLNPCLVSALTNMFFTHRVDDKG